MLPAHCSFGLLERTCNNAKYVANRDWTTNDTKVWTKNRFFYSHLASFIDIAIFHHVDWIQYDRSRTSLERGNDGFAKDIILGFAKSYFPSLKLLIYAPPIHTCVLGVLKFFIRYCCRFTSMLPWFLHRLIQGITFFWKKLTIVLRSRQVRTQRGGHGGLAPWKNWDKEGSSPIMWAVPPPLICFAPPHNPSYTGPDHSLKQQKRQVKIGRSLLWSFRKIRKTFISNVSIETIFTVVSHELKLLVKYNNIEGFPYTTFPYSLCPRFHHHHLQHRSQMETTHKITHHTMYVM